MKLRPTARIILSLALPLLLPNLHAEPDEASEVSPSAGPTLSITEVSSATKSTMEVDLTILGTYDWIIWGEWVGDTGFEYDRKSGNPGYWTLSSVEELGEGGEPVTGQASKIGGENVGFRFNYTDGTSESGEQKDINEGIGRRIGNSREKTPDGVLTLTVELKTASGSLHLFVSGDNVVHEQELSAMISDQNATVHPRWDYEPRFLHYKIDFSGVEPGSLLEVKWDGLGRDYNSRIIINACALRDSE